tara:strand:- start:294 stop:491 length:198 start_codon:yes stop_codon:yes gene_type:complete
MQNRLIVGMKKISDNIFGTIEIDPVTSEYKIIVPESIINEMGWYEETVVQWSIEDKDVIIRESDD